MEAIMRNRGREKRSESNRSEERREKTTGGQLRCRRRRRGEERRGEERRGEERRGEERESSNDWGLRVKERWCVCFEVREKRGMRETCKQKRGRQVIPGLIHEDPKRRAAWIIIIFTLWHFPFKRMVPLFPCTELSTLTLKPLLLSSLSLLSVCWVTTWLSLSAAWSAAPTSNFLGVCASVCASVCVCVFVCVYMFYSKCVGVCICLQ